MSADYTAQEYFESRRERLFPDAQTVITRTCLTYLLFDDLESRLGGNFEGDLLFVNHPLLEYAALYWGRHASGDVELIERSLLLKFLRSPHHVTLSSQILLENEVPWRHPIPLPSL